MNKSIIKFRLVRTQVREFTTDGKLTTRGGRFICNTAEYTPHCMREGSYKLTLMTHPKYKRLAPAVLTPEGTVFMGMGNGVYTLGSHINVGKYLVPGVLIRTDKIFKKLVKRLEKQLARGSEIILIIQSN